MLEKVRKKYELEKLWALGEEYDDQCREMKADLLSEEDLLNMDMMEEEGSGGRREGDRGIMEEGGEGMIEEGGGDGDGNGHTERTTSSTEGDSHCDYRQYVD